MHCIYALIDPREPERFYYIGHTMTPRTRLRAHCNEKARTPKRRWIRRLLAQGVRPKLKVIEQFEIGFPYGRERYWIKFFTKLGHPLTNVYTGTTVENDCPPLLKFPSATDAWEAYTKHRNVAKAANQLNIGVPRFLMLVKCRSKQAVRTQFDAIKASDSILALQLGVHREHAKKV